MKKSPPKKDELLSLTIDEVSSGGLSGFSLRKLANAASISTTVIFQNFSSKAELIESAARLAAKRDKLFHDALFDQAGHLITTHAGFADFLARYILMRSSHPQSCFMSELLISLGDYPNCNSFLQNWHSERVSFWTQLLEDLKLLPNFATIIAEFVLMEEFYAYALGGDITYEILLAETCRALADAAFHGDAAGQSESHISLRLNTQPWSLGEAEDNNDAPIKELLLSEALNIINEQGLEALNQRRLAKNAGVSSSAIAYYFKDMKQFRNRAIWRALVKGIPSQLDPEHSEAALPQNLDAWLETLNDLLQITDNEQPAGFYIGFARLTGQACLLSRNDRSLLPLIAYLRQLEGWGTYRVSRNIAGLSDVIGRDHAAAFGVWIKSEALLRRVRLSPPGTSLDRLKFAANHIFPRQKFGANTLSNSANLRHKKQ